jgi:4-carboxymuconolactone decarboxylase
MAIERFPAVFRDYMQLGMSTRQAGALDEKTQDLVKLGIAVGANSQGAVMSHTCKCLAAGSTPEEIVHVVLLTLTTTGSPNMIAALRWVKAVLHLDIGSCSFKFYTRDRDHPDVGFRFDFVILHKMRPGVVFLYNPHSSLRNIKVYCPSLISTVRSAPRASA